MGSIDQLQGVPMDQIVNGMPVTELPPLTWQKSRRSNPSGNCVELAMLPDGAAIAVRDSKDPFGPALIYPATAIREFVIGVRNGDFDDAG
jgi:hypothetical protein